MAKFDFSESSVQERMMRVGIEARGIVDSNEIYQIAVDTLKADAKRYAHHSLKLSTDIAKLFATQISNAN